MLAPRLKETVNLGRECFPMGRQRRAVCRQFGADGPVAGSLAATVASRIRKHLSRDRCGKGKGSRSGRAQARRRTQADRIPPADGRPLEHAFFADRGASCRPATVWTSGAIVSGSVFKPPGSTGPPRWPTTAASPPNAIRSIRSVRPTVSQRVSLVTPWDQHSSLAHCLTSGIGWSVEDYSSQPACRHVTPTRSLGLKREV
jgi:hypothetical protein